MKRQMFTLILLCTATGAFAQQPGGRGGGRGQAPQPAPLFFKETWKECPGNVPVTQDFVMNPDLQLNLYGAGKEDFGVTSEGNVPHIWTGTLRLILRAHAEPQGQLCGSDGQGKNPLVHQDVGVSRGSPRFETRRRNVAHWRPRRCEHVRLSRKRILSVRSALAQTRYAQSADQGDLLDKVDLSKVDAVGFADLTPGSGHGTGGYSDVAWIEVYGKPVKRDTANQPH